VPPEKQILIHLLLDMSKLLPPEAAAFAGVMKMSATVAPTNETKKIGQWNCQGYTMTVSMMGQNITTKIRASEDVGFDTAAFNSKNLGNMSKGGGMMLDDASLKDFAKLKGFQVYSETTGNIMGATMRSTTEVQEISTKSASSGICAGRLHEDRLAEHGRAAEITSPFAFSRSPVPHRGVGDFFLFPAFPFVKRIPPSA
jgi:hypothetical protein